MLRQPSLRSIDTYSLTDPLAIRPEPNESPEARENRIQGELAARKVSASIDEQLRQERIQRAKNNKTDVKLLLLGQAESGKSTLQKQFSLMHRGPHSLESERASWTTVVYQNTVSPIKHILQVLEDYGEDNEEPHDAPSSHSDDGASSASPLSDRRRRDASIANQPSPSTSPSESFLHDLAAAGPSSPSAAYPPATPKDVPIAQLRLRLSPLVAVEQDLSARLSGANIFSTVKGAVVRAGWQSRTLESTVGKSSRWSKRGQDVLNKTGNVSPKGGSDFFIEEIGRILEASVGDIQALWTHPLVRMLIAKRKLKLDEWAEFFLTHIVRIASTGYLPTTEDILHARVVTLGISEDCFDVSIHGKQARWHLYDVGGARGQRPSWIPYFEGSNAIIFVAPVSAFDQYLEEDSKVNRIDDSLSLFTSICSNPLLKDVHLVLFLNKTDLLQSKLDMGLSVKKYITSFGDRPNTYEATVSYFKAHFLQVHRKNNEAKRVLYTHLTSCVDTKTTQAIIGNVRDSIFRGYLKSAALV